MVLCTRVCVYVFCGVLTIDIESPIEHPRVRDRPPQLRRRTVLTAQCRTLIPGAAVREPQETRRPYLPLFARLVGQAPVEHPFEHPERVPAARVRGARAAAEVCAVGARGVARARACDG